MTVAALSRPRLLAAAARAGVSQYRRDRDLAGLVPAGTPGRALLAALAEAEAACDADRRLAAPGYSVARHVRVLTALLAEARAAARTAAAVAPQAGAPMPLRRRAAAPSLEFKSAA